jgi:hypothetical protein
LDDYFILTLNDAQTGHNLLSGGGIRIDGNDLPANTWVLLSVQISGLNTLTGRNVSLHYSGWSDELRPTLLVVDNVGFATSCTSTNSPSAATRDDGLLTWHVAQTPVAGPLLFAVDR